MGCGDWTHRILDLSAVTWQAKHPPAFALVCGMVLSRRSLTVIVFVLGAGCQRTLSPATGPVEREQPALTIAPPARPATSATSPSAAQSAFRLLFPWLRTSAYLGMYPIKSGVAVIVHSLESYAEVRADPYHVPSLGRVGSDRHSWGVECSRVSAAAATSATEVDGPLS